MISGTSRQAQANKKERSTHSASWFRAPVWRSMMPQAFRSTYHNKPRLTAIHH